MWFRFLADVTLIAHLAFILFVVLGGFFVVRWPRIAWLHAPAAIWGVLIELEGWICPLTPLENHLRRLGGEAGYTGGFIEHYILGLIYPQGLSRTVQLVLGLGVLILNVALYSWAFRRFRERERIRRTGSA
jgi:hypothetical protein